MISFITSIGDELSHRDPIVNAIFISFGISLFLFLFWCLLLSYKYSQEELTKIRYHTYCIRYLICIEVLLITPLIYIRSKLGPPFQLHVVTDYGNGDSWIYGYGRPITGIILIGIGSFCNVHFVIRNVATAGCLIQISLDIISAVQISSYQQQMNSSGAPSRGYSNTTYTLYKYRDVISIGVCTVISLSLSLLSWMICYGKERKYSVYEIEDERYNSLAAMRKQLSIRKRV